MRVVTDVRFAMRVLARRPLVTVAAVLSLALGIGANAALFSVLDALMFRRLDVTSPEELVRYSDSDRDAFTLAAYDRLGTAARLPSGVIAMTKLFSRGTSVAVRGATSEAFVQLVSDNYFDVLGISLTRGHAFRTVGEPVAVISEAFWRTQLGGSEEAVGAHLSYQGREFVVAGVATAGFRGTDLDHPTDIWLPLNAVILPGAPERTRGRWIFIMARSRQGVTMPQLAAEATGILGAPITAESAATGYSLLRRRLSRPLALVEILAALILLLTCVNLANLTLAGTSARAREMTIRRAIGASRARLVCQLGTEGVLLTVVGGGLAALVAYGLHASILRFLPNDQLPVLPNLGFALDGRMVWFATTLGAATCILFSVIPAVISTSAPSTAEMRAGTSGWTLGRAWRSRALFAFEAAACALLLMVSGVFLRSVHNLRVQDTGYREEGLLVADVALPPTFPGARSDALLAALQSRVMHLPGIKVAAFSDIGQLSGFSIELPIRTLGGPPVDSTRALSSSLRVSPGFFGAMGTALLAGRDFSGSDDQRGAPVAIVNTEFARRFLATGNPIGQRFVPGGTPIPTPLEIVGVVQDVKWLGLRDAPIPIFYRPYWQDPGAGQVRLAVQSSGSLATLAGALGREARAVDGQIVLRNVGPFSRVVDGTLVTERIVSQGAGALGALALVIAAVGLYGVLAYQVNQRRRELAVRIALGARPRTVQSMVIRDAAIPLAAGWLVGVPASVLVTRLGASLLFGVAAADLWTLSAVLVVLTMVTAMASYFPARRAATVDPMVALQAE